LEQAKTREQVLLSEFEPSRQEQHADVAITIGDRGATSGKRGAREVLEEASGRVTAMAAAQRVLYATLTRRGSTRVIFSIPFCENHKARPSLRNWILTVKLIPYSCRTMRRCRSR